MPNMWVAYTEIWCYNHQAPFHGSPQQNISLFSLLLISAVQNCLKWLGNAVYTIFTVVFLCKFVSFMGGQIWIRHGRVCCIQFCNTCFDFLPKVGIGSRTCSSLGSNILNMFLLKCQSQNSLFSLQLSTTCAYTGCCPCIWTNLFWSHCLFHRAAYLCHWWCCQVHCPCC
jgi:hypothetical protein